MDNSKKTNQSAAAVEKPTKKSGSPAAAPFATEPQLATEKKKSKKPLIILLVIAGVLLLAGIGLLIWWLAYYNSDSKVLSDAFYKIASSTEGTVDMKMNLKMDDPATSETYEVEANVKQKFNQEASDIKIDGRLSRSGVSAELSANMVTDNSNLALYVRLNELDKLINAVNGSYLVENFDIRKISDKWIKIDLEEQLGNGDYLKCLLDVSKTATEKKDIQKEIFEAITESEFLTAKRVGSDEDGIKFKLTENSENDEKFINAVFKSQLYQMINDCANKVSDDENLTTADDVDNNDQQTIGDIEIHFWVNSWSHQATRLSVTVGMTEDNYEVDYSLDFTYKEEKVEVTIPEESTDLTTIIEEYQSSNPFWNYPYSYDYDNNAFGEEEIFDYNQIFLN